MRKPDSAPFAIRVWKFDHWVYVGPIYPSREIAKGWLSFFRSAWSGMKTRVVSKQQVEREKNRCVA